jgi:hypothetical protein
METQIQDCPSKLKNSARTHWDEELLVYLSKKPLLRDFELAGPVYLRQAV